MKDIEQIRDFFRKTHNIDIEISCVYETENHAMKKIGYRYLITFWTNENIFIKNVYCDDVYTTYIEAFNAAINKITMHLNNKTMYYTTSTFNKIIYKYVD